MAPNGRQILKNVHLGMYLGAKIGILGQNGAGKSTVMKILAGEDKEFDGERQLAPGIKVSSMCNSLEVTFTLRGSGSVTECSMSFRKATDVLAGNIDICSPDRHAGWDRMRFFMSALT